MRSVTVVGASLAGLSAARALRAQGYDGRLVLVGAEKHQPYDRPPLSKEFLAGAMPADELGLTTADDAELDLCWRLGRTATGLDPAERAVVLDSGERISADGVVIATGARARQLPGPRLAGVHTLRTLEDAVGLRAELLPGVRLVVIGAGFIGAEVASTARGLGAEVTVVEVAPTPLAGPLGPEMGAVVAGLHADHGVRLITNAGGVSLVGDGRVRAVRLPDDRELPADVVVVGIGAVPCTEWLAGSGLTSRGGVVTDERCATSIPQVVATGDCAVTRHSHTGAEVRFEHWDHALRQPAVAAATLLGQDPPPAPLPYFWSDQYGVRLQFAGHRHPGDQVEVVEGDPAARAFLALYRRDGRPVAVLAMNQPKSFARWRRQLARATPAATADHS